MSKKTKKALAGGGIVLIAAVTAIILILVKPWKNVSEEPMNQDHLVKDDTWSSSQESKNEESKNEESKNEESKNEKSKNEESNNEVSNNEVREESGQNSSAESSDEGVTEAGGSSFGEEKQSLDQLLYQDFKNGDISADEYVKNILYALYEHDKLDSRYDPDAVLEREIRPLWLAEEYFDKLEDDTKYYLLEHISLEKELVMEDQSVSAGINPFFPQAFLSFPMLVADAEPEGSPYLEFVISGNRNFIVWYFTAGSNATTKEAAENIAEGMEDAIEKYDALFGTEYRFEPISKASGKIRRILQKKLEDAKQDPDMVDNTMQIFLVKFDEALAQYDDIGNQMLTWYTQLQSTMNSVSLQTFPYIKINPSETLDMENLEQLYKHEMFHHYQTQVLNVKNGKTKTVGDWEHALESTAIWASGLVTNKTTNKGNNNNFCAMARSNPNLLLDEKTLKKHGAKHMSYALLLYLYNYSSFYGDGGPQKVVDAMYEQNFLSALAEKASPEELWEIEGTYALKNLTIDYDNMNFVYNPEDSELNYHYILGLDEEVKLNRIGAEYYRFRAAGKEQFVREFSFETDSDYVLALLAGEKDGVYTLLDQTAYGEHEKVMPAWTEDGTEYDSYWLVVANADLEHNHTCSVKMTSKEKTGEEDDGTDDGSDSGSDSGTDSGSARAGMFTVEVLNYSSDYDLEHHYETFYYDSAGQIYRLIITNVYSEEEMERRENLNGIAESLKQGGNYTEVFVNGNTLTAEVAVSNWNWGWAYRRFETYADIQNFLADPEPDCIEVPDFTPGVSENE